MSSNSPPPISASKNGWGPYSGERDFNRNMLIIVFILIFALFFFLILHATTRFFYSLRFRRAQMQEMGVVLPTTLLVFSEGMMKGQASAESTECAICLCEFVEGDGLRVLPNCKHWFHEKCVEVWLNCSGSCPTCRSSCMVVGKDVPEKREVLGVSIRLN